jgi:beta-lactamase superfamily II metal-dependent hydrolase
VRLGPDLVLFAPSLQPDEASANDRALALRGRLGGLSFLLLSDQQEAGLGDLLRRDALPRSDLLFAPHHGGSCSLTPELLARVRPKLVLVSDGTRFGHPAEESRYRASGALCLRTSQCGEITVLIGNGPPVVETFRPWSLEPGALRRQ